MKIVNLFEELLTELSPKEIYDKYYQDIPQNTWHTIVGADPQTVIKNGEQVRLGKYAKVLLQLYKVGQLRMEDLSKAKEYLTYVYKYHVPLDIKSIGSLSDIYNLIQKYVTTETSDIGSIIRSLTNGKDYQMLLNGKEWMVLTPLNEKSACHLGVGTQWCTTWGPHSLTPSYRGRTNYFKSHNDREKLYIIINKLNPEKKYQFHFNSNQFMDSRDAAINVPDFFRHAPEVKYFFFPTLAGKGNEEQYEWEKDHFTLLPNKDAVQIIKHMAGGRGNKIISAILAQDDDALNNQIHSPDEHIAFGISDNFQIDVSIKPLTGELQYLESIVSSLNHDKNSSHEMLYNQIMDGVQYGEGWKEEIGPFFQKYYEEDSESVHYNLKCKDYETFKRRYFEEFIDNDDIQTEYVDKSVEMSEQNYEAAYQAEIDEIENIISIDEYHGTNNVHIKGTHFIKYILEKNIEEINDVDQFINDFIDDNGLPTSYYDPPEYYPEYAEYEHMKSYIENYFDELSTNFDDEYENQCLKYRESFRRIHDELFKNKMEYENDYVRINLQSGIVNCEDGTIMIEYINKGTNKKYSGPVKIESLYTYAYNYELFESYLSFKKNVK